ncbi:esterase [Oceanobacillus picturae]|uniref:Esterase n=1 Tax=Oceanobacillus picturae TaxID=171693 RepID=A0A0U9H644_9BACI|nr:alpha/beta hydrolase-fold protein [Oceanobacillus picturae]GAQ18114.1 esterase [Oceanobacillus picturae]
MSKYNVTQFTIDGPHHPFQIDVSVPAGEAPEQGFPVLYVLDGNAYFSLVKEIIKLQQRRPEKTGVDQMILVGIGYPGEDAFSRERFYDYTPPAETVNLPERPDGLDWPEQGGAEHFLDFIEQTLQPKIMESHPVDQTNQSLFGHSLGGLLTVYSLFTRPQLFQHYLAFSPSIWWNDRVILTKEADLEVNKEKRLFIAVEDSDQFEMYSQAEALYQRLQEEEKLKQVAFFSSSGENHMSIVPTALSSSLRFLEGGLDN